MLFSAGPFAQVPRRASFFRWRPAIFCRDKLKKINYLYNYPTILTYIYADFTRRPGRYERKAARPDEKEGRGRRFPAEMCKFAPASAP